jgi:hypothetical protein
MDPLDRYRTKLTWAKEELRKDLAGRTSFASTIAIDRRTCAIMESDLKGQPQSVLLYDHYAEGTLRGPDLWWKKSRQTAAKPYERPDPSAWIRKNNEYMDLIRSIRRRDALPELFKDPQRGIAYLVQENPLVSVILTMLIAGLAAWVAEHSSDPDFLTYSARVGLIRMLEERQDLVAALRLAQLLPKDHEEFAIPIDRPALVEFIETAVQLIPLFGSAVAVTEAFTGRDMFGYELDPVERAVLTAGCLLPAVARLFKEGKVLYTAARMTKLYGSDAAEWSLAIARGERLARDPAAARLIVQANTTLRAGRKLSADLAKAITEAMKRLGLKGTTQAVSFTPLEKAFVNSLKGLIRNKPFLAELDELALQRVIAKTGINQMKGQLLEELLESRVVGWLRESAGAVALGIPRPLNGLEFFPGHLIRDARGRQITDGILAHWVGNELEIVAVFEAKAGPRAARELAFASGGISKLTKEERDELRAYAIDIFRDRRAEARLTGAPFPTTRVKIDEMIRDIELEVNLTEQGGQVRRDVERMAENEDGTPAKLLIGTELTSVRISPTKTKFFGVLPKNVPPGDLERELQQLGYQFDVLGMNVTDKELIELTESVLQLFVTWTP